VLLNVKDLRVHFPIRGGVLRRVRRHIRAVDGVSFTVNRAETFGLVGESGCGKTTVGRAILRLIPATGGEVIFDGHNVLALRGKNLRRLRRHMQIVFQDPAGSLNSRMRVDEIVGEPLLVHRIARGRELQMRVAQLLQRCGIDPTSAQRYPHEFSGGQRQRIAIARALALNPKLIICDEPTSALDVSVQAQILNLLKDLQAESGLAYLFISHDLAVVNHMCDRIAVMMNGKVVEAGDRQRIVHDPQHEYTRALMAAVPAFTPLSGSPLTTQASA
jgi:ABC-type oligopeptide transport system ATPase subunit